MTGWQQIGEIAVDTGQVVLVDPLNLDDVPEQMDAALHEDVTNEHAVLGVIVSSGLGDGVYPVEARFEEAAGVVRVAEIRITFLPHPVLGYELFG